MGDGDAEVKFRAWKPKADGNLRPLILQVKDPEKRERILDSGRKLTRKVDWKRVFVAPESRSNTKAEGGRKEERSGKEQKSRRENEEGQR